MWENLPGETITADLFDLLSGVASGGGCEETTAAATGGLVDVSEVLRGLFVAGRGGSTTGATAWGDGEASGVESKGILFSF